MIGVDFDNTIADYGDLMHEIAVERELIQPDFPRSKKLIRDAIRALPDGESRWRGVQVSAYGPRMAEARLIEGAREFFIDAKSRGIPIFIVSHKTEFANFGDANVNLRRAAMEWLEQEGFFDPAGVALRREDVFFESTRAEKIERAKSLGVTHFIDDLEETFEEKSFPDEVLKLLLAPLGEPTSLSDAVSFSTWREIRERVFGGMDLDAIGELAGAAVRAVARIGRGGNSKVYRVACADLRTYAAKLYFQRTMDGLNRLDVEFTGLQFLWQNGERAIPRPISADREKQIALYEFVAGSPVAAEVVGMDEIDQAVLLAGRLKALSCVAGAERLQRAAEACFSFAELDDSIEARLRRLESIPGSEASYSDLRHFLAGELRPAYAEAVGRVRAAVGEGGWRSILPQSRRTLSPSDFGFHNALYRTDGTVLFLDFEYFGWDDPVKMIADFLLHPAMRLSDVARDRYATGMIGCFSDPGLPERLILTYPMLAIKWCAILLNEFVPTFLARREFAGRGSRDSEELRLGQLEKARKMLLLAMRGAPSAVSLAQ